MVVACWGPWASLVGCCLVKAGWDEGTTVMEMVLMTAFPFGIQRGFAEVATTMRCSFAGRKKKGIKSKTKWTRRVAEVAVSQNPVVFTSHLVWMAFKTQAGGLA